MRTIEFRGQSTHNGEWLHGSLVSVEGNLHIVGPDDMCEDGHHIRQESDRPTWVKEETVGQFTGICDMNGIKIFEGDVLMTEGILKKCFFEVRWVEEKFMFFLGDLPLHEEVIKDKCLCNFSVAGNVYK